MSESGLKDLVKEHKLEQDHKREVDQKHKWALGEGPVTCGQSGRRPAKPFGSICSNGKAWKRQVIFEQNKARKHGIVVDTDASASDTSAEEDVKEASSAPEPDAGYTYSYDLPRGPGKGSQILGMALAKAVEKFETKVTEKLVKEEYEVIGAEKAESHTGYLADDDDFELV